MKKNPPNTKPEKLKCDVQTLALAFGITDRQIQKLSAAGILPKNKKGEYDFIAVTAAYLAHVRQSFKQSANKTTLELETIREKKTLNDEREWSFEQKRGLFTTLSAVEEFFDNVIPAWNSKFDAIRNRLNNFLRTNSDPEKTVTYANQCLDELLQELAGTNPADFIDSAKAETDVAAGEDALQRMGRQVSETEPGSE